MFIPIPVLAAFGAAFLFLLILTVQRATQIGEGERGTRRTASSPMAASLEPQFRTELRGLVAQRHKIDAIKLVREKTGLGLKEAKDLVDALEES